MKLKSALLLLFCLCFKTAAFSQKIESEGYLIVQHVQSLSDKAMLNILNPAGESEQIMLEKIHAGYEKQLKISSNNQVQLLKVLEFYRKKDYELIGVTSEMSGSITNYILKKRQ